MKKKKEQSKTVKIVKTGVSAAVSVGLVAAMVLANTYVPANASAIYSILGIEAGGIDNSNAKTDGVNVNYNSSDFKTEEELVADESQLNRDIAGEGIVLLENENNSMPFSTDTTFSFVSHSSVAFNGAPDLKTAFEDAGFSVNDTLWNFYKEGNGSEYGLGVGSVSYGDDEDFSINECPLSVMEAESGLLDSMKDTTPVFILERVAGEGRDMPRSMYNHTDIEEDKTKSYLEPDSVELEILQYLNDNYDDVVLIVNSSAALQLDWVDDFSSIHTIVHAPALGDYGVTSLAEIFSGEINPSGHLVDTYEADASNSPAAQNFGDFAYYTENGELTNYNYVSYKEGIYVGYKYYETRYEDVVLGQGNAGDFDYSSEVVYPFGYGLSYTDFAWSDYSTSWDDDTCTVNVTVTNTGDAAGKDVVQIYAQSPYTEYDKENAVEKAAAELVGYDKTKLLAPGESETLTITFDQEQLKSYDYTNAQTYILDAGDYYITAASDAHKAVNNILAAKGKTTADGMTEDGNADFVNVYTPDITEVDTVTYAKDTATGTEITNQFDDANGGFTYLSRNDWTGTWPTTDGEASDVISTWGNEINGTDAEGKPAAYTYMKTLTDEELQQLESFDSLNPNDGSELTDEIVYGADNGVTLIDLRGLSYDDELWDKLLDQLTVDDYQTLINQSGYQTAAVASVDKPVAIDRDSARGLLNYSIDASGNLQFQMYITHAGAVVMAQTFNDEFPKHMGINVGNTSYFIGVDGWYAPAVNIHRTPYSGRNAEYFSEDAFISGQMAALEIEGAASKGMYVYLKHFAVNDQENHRGDREGQYSLATFLNEQSARELYLKPFEMCVKSGTVEMNYIAQDENGNYYDAVAEIPACNGIMTSFNRIGYTWAGGNWHLITGVLRNEWGFNGFVITDNANTSVFMKGSQMIEAGADAKLANVPDVTGYDFDENSVVEYHYGREAIHHMLYTIVNSKAMDGGMSGSVYVEKVQAYQKILYAIDAVCIGIIAVLGVLTILRFRKKKVQ